MTAIKKEPIVIDADVLIIGGGLAGTWAAIRAKDFVENVVLVDKARVAKSGCSVFAAGVMLGPQEGDDLYLWKKEIAERGDYLGDQDWIELMLSEQIQRMRQMVAWGVPFEKDQSGKLIRIVGRAHEITRLVMFQGKNFMKVMREQTIKKGVRLIERVMITDLLSSDGILPTGGAIIGATGLNPQTGETYLFRSKATIISSGPICNKWSAYQLNGNNCGDGQAMAFRSGAALTGMEFVTGGNISCWQRKYYSMGINMIQGYGGKYLNVLGERFMEKYSPGLMERVQMHLMSQAFAKEALEGRGPIMVDLRHLSDETIERFKRVIPHFMEIMKDAKVDLKNEMIESTPHGGIGNPTGTGGIKIDLDCRTNLTGLYAAGSVTRVPPQGIYSVGGVALCNCCTSGYRAGETAAKFAGQNASIQPSPSQIKDFTENLVTYLETTSSLSPDDVYNKICFANHAKYSLFKNAKRIDQVLSVIEEVKRVDLPRIRAFDTHELMKCLETKNFATCAELVFRAAAVREESRSWHYREEFPYRDDVNWLKLVVFTMSEGKPKIHYEPVPIERYTFQPLKREKIPHPVQFTYQEPN